MKRRSNYYCPVCENDNYGDELVFDLREYGEEVVCETCFEEFIHNNFPNLEELPTKKAADELGIYYTTVETFLEDEYNLYMEANYEDR